VLRVARFAARYHHLGFHGGARNADSDGGDCPCGELPHLSTERVWVETEKALGEQQPRGVLAGAV
jgi:tRNA nucleotidyltransferase (CCA-adding enzyme)